MHTPTASATDPRSYVLPAGIISNIPASAGPTERGVFAAARGLTVEAAARLVGPAERVLVQDNRGTFADGHVEVTVYVTVAAPASAGKMLVTLVWGLGGGRTDWVLTMDRYDRGRSVDHRHLGSADGRLPAPAELARLIPTG